MRTRCTALAVLALSCALTACDDRSGAARPATRRATAPHTPPALRVLGFTAPAAWSPRDCGIDVPKSLAPDTLRPYRRCDWYDSTSGTSLILDWERGLVVGGNRSFFLPDSVRWQAFRDSVLATLEAMGTPMRCAKAESELGDTLERAEGVRLWVLREERRSVVFSERARSGPHFDYPPEWVGNISVNTRPGAVDPCRILLRPRRPRGFVM